MAGSFDQKPDGPAFQADPIFKGCTRPAMLWGIPLMPCVGTFLFFILLTVWFSWLFLIPLPAVLFGMRKVVRTDDQAFRLHGLRLQFRLIHFNRNGRFWKASAYSPIPFAKRK